MQPGKVLKGTVATVTFHNPENGYFVAKVVPADSMRDMAVPVVGTTRAIYPGEVFEGEGSWEKSDWGMQFKAATVKLSLPANADGIYKYLASGAIKGVGKTWARKLVDAFGDRTFDVLENHPEELAKLPKLGAKRLEALTKDASSAREEREIMSFLQGHMISVSVAKKIYEVYGKQAVPKLRENPYRLSADIFGVGFLTTDKFALALGVGSDSPFRVRAGLHHVLSEASGLGSCGLPVTELLQRNRELLGASVDEAMVRIGIADALTAKELMKDRVKGVECVFLPRLYRAEHDIARHIKSRVQQVPLMSEADAARRIAEAEAICKIKLGAEQRHAVTQALRYNLCVITGGPGRGKTACIKVLVVAAKRNNEVVVQAAPTGKAAKRLAESTGHLAQTLHMTLGAGPKGWKFNAENPLEADLVIVDEFSMVDVALAATLLAALKSDTRLVLVGDRDQLPSVGPGRVFADLVLSQALPIGLLQQTFRQAEGSLIIAAADCVNKGEAPPDGAYNDYIFINKKEAEDVVAAVLDTVRSAKFLGFDPKTEVQVLSPMRKGPVGVQRLNELIREILTPPGPEYKVNGYKSFRKGDKVIQTKNNRGLRIMNGDIGYVTGFDEENLTVDFDGVGPVCFQRKIAAELELAYCITVHKSQGAEAPMVVMPVCTSHFIMMQRNLLYTGMTRAKKRLVLVGQRWVAKKAAENAVIEDRHSMLLELLRPTRARAA